MIGCETMASDAGTPVITIELHRAQPAHGEQNQQAPERTTACEVFWRTNPEPVDEGLPSRVIDCVSDTFCAFGAIAFVSDMPDAGGGLLARIKSRFRSAWRTNARKDGYSLRRLHMPRVRSGPLWLVDTTLPSIARDLFLIQAWHYAPCQVGFIRKPDGDPVALADADIQAVILNGDWSALNSALHASSSKAVFTPGHDGASLKLVFANPQTMAQFDDTLKACCAAYQLPYASTL